MARLQQVGLRFTNQFAQFGFQSQGQSATTISPTLPGPFNQLLFFDFTKQFVAFRSLGQTSTTPPPSGGGQQFLIGGPDITEQFVTGGHISALGISYTINPLSRRTV